MEYFLGPYGPLELEGSAASNTSSMAVAEFFGGIPLGRVYVDGSYLPPHHHPPTTLQQAMAQSMTVDHASQKTLAQTAATHPEIRTCGSRKGVPLSSLEYGVEVSTRAVPLLAWYADRLPTVTKECEFKHGGSIVACGSILLNLYTWAYERFPSFEGPLSKVAKIDMRLRRGETFTAAQCEATISNDSAVRITLRTS